MLIFIPTFNEWENVETMCRELLALNLGADITFLDDNSPDGTGDVLDRLAAAHPQVSVIHRVGKRGIGSAHLDGIDHAYARGYRTLVTMDCDFTHSPADIRRFLEHSATHPVVIGSRYQQENSLPGWNLFRRSLTNLGHLMTVSLLGMPYDATGAFRVYDLTKIPRDFFQLVRSKGYAFFFESLFLLHRNGFAIHEVPIVLPARTYGHSKMSWKEAARSARQVWSLFLQNKANPAQFQYAPPLTPAQIDPALVDPQGWDAYWSAKQHPGNAVYEIIAAVYRTTVIRRNLNQAIRRHFAPGSVLLHAGCGSGQVDMDLQREMRLTGLDISVPALQLYRRNNPHAAGIRHASIFALPFADNTFDGVYNLGVMEHFTAAEIQAILREFRRVLKPGGKVVLFWPMQQATSVLVLGIAHQMLNAEGKPKVQLHPPEISLLPNCRHGRKVLSEAGLEPVETRFGPQDFFVQTVIVGQKPHAAKACATQPCC